jgi:hypothetical protein
MSEIEELRKRIEQLEAEKPKPIPPRPQYWAPPDYTKNFHVPIASVIDDRTVRDIARAGAAAAPSSTIPEKKTIAPPVERGNGWRDVPAKPQRVPGIAAIDAIAKGFADREKTEQLAQLADVASKLRGL